MTNGRAERGGGPNVSRRPRVPLSTRGRRIFYIHGGGPLWRRDGGEWPSTDLYASATHVQAKQAKSLEPVYLKGEEQGETKLTQIAPGQSVTVALRMDWPGTGSVKAAPLLASSESESYVRVLMVFDRGRNARQYAASASKYVKVVDE